MSRTEKLRLEVELLQRKVAKLRDARDLNEQNTKSALITPMLEALGWDVSNPEEVHYEYRHRPKDSPVDYALMVQRMPCLFVEAKAIGQNLDDRKWTNQVLAYSTQSGVPWVVLTNGIEYHVYNSHAPVPLEGKLFKKLTLEGTKAASLVDDLSLLTKADFIGKRIDRAWESHHVDSQVRDIIDRLFGKVDGAGGIERLIVKLSDGKLSSKAVRESLQRAVIRVDFPPLPGLMTTDALTRLAPSDSGIERVGGRKKSPASPSAENRASKRNRRRTAKEGDRSETSPSSASTSLADLIAAGVIRSPAALVANYLGHEVRATVVAGGEIELDGNRHPSLSAAAGHARIPYYRGDQNGSEYPATNGWVFWSTKDPETGELVTMDTLRRRLGKS